MAAAAFDLPRNFSLYCVPAAWILSIAPHIYASGLGKFDNRTPRTYTRSVEADQSVDKATKDRIIRAEGAQQNGFENVGLFAAAVVAGNVARLDNWTLNALSGAYLVNRVVYNWVYINNTSEVMANTRTAVFLSGVGILFTFFIKSGNALRDHL